MLKVFDVAKRLSIIFLLGGPIFLSSCVSFGDCEVIVSNEYNKKQPKTIAILLFEGFREDDKFTFLVLAGSTDCGKAGEVVTEAITKELMKTGLYTIVERERISAVLQEKKFNISDIVKQESLDNLKEMLGVDAVVVGKVTSMKDAGAFFMLFWDQVEASCKMISVEDGSILWSADLMEKTIYFVPMGFFVPSGPRCARSACEKMAKNLKEKVSGL